MRLSLALLAAALAFGCTACCGHTAVPLGADGGRGSTDGGVSCLGKPDGTSCGLHLACLGGLCSCQPGGSCSVAGNPCQAGSFSCGGGTPSCGNVQNLPDGTSCGTGQVCRQGSCVACSAGSTCLAGPCLVGTLSCGSGSSQCANPQPAQNGISCSADGGFVCDNGSCIACAAGSSCNPPGNPCMVGALDCSSGVGVCASTIPAPDGTSCGGALVCLGGSCTTCVTGAACDPPTNACQVGSLTCGASPSCVGPYSNAPNNKACGNGQICQSGNCSCANPCNQAGSTCASGTQVATCTLDPQNGCFLQSFSNCSSGQVCAGGSCVCQNGCSAGQVQCAGSSAEYCQAGAGGCLSWSAPTACPGGVSCVNGACACPAPQAGQLVVNASSGSDGLGNGSASCPFATISHALAVAASQGTPVTISLKGGSYALGESFPLVVPANVTISGGSLIQGSGPVGDGSGISATVVLNGGSLSGVELKPAVQDSPSTAGIYCTALSPSVTNGVEIHRFQYGVYLSGSCSATIDGADIHDNGQGSGGGDGIDVVGSASATVQNSHVHSNATGVSLASAGFNPTSLIDDEIDSNQADGVDCLATAKLTMRLDFVHQNHANGVAISASCSADLSGAGTAGTPCAEANTFTCNATGGAGAADVISTSSIPVAADHDNWDFEPPSAEDVRAASGGSVATSPTCSTQPGAPNPQGAAPTGCP